MWFKQAQLFHLKELLNFSNEHLEERLQELIFKTCLPSMPQSSGWIPPLEEHGKLLRSINSYTMLCLQIEEKILPNSVINQELAEAIKQIETSENRKLRTRDKFALKDEVVMAMLPRAFSKLHKIYAYLDSKNHSLILGTANSKKTEQFLSIFKKSLGVEVEPIKIKNPAPKMTQWLKQQNYPTSFAIEKSCVLQDTKQEARVIRCKQQNLFAPAIQSLLADGCAAIQLALTWQDRVKFVLTQDGSLSSLQFQEEITDHVKEIAPETITQEFDADFIMMSETLVTLFNDLIEAFGEEGNISAIAKSA